MNNESQNIKQPRVEPALSQGDSSGVLSKPGASLEVRVVKMSQHIKEAISRSLAIANERVSTIKR